MDICMTALFPGKKMVRLEINLTLVCSQIDEVSNPLWVMRARLWVSCFVGECPKSSIIRAKP